MLNSTLGDGRKQESVGGPTGSMPPPPAPPPPKSKSKDVEFVAPLPPIDTMPVPVAPFHSRVPGTIVSSSMNRSTRLLYKILCVQVIIDVLLNASACGTFGRGRNYSTPKPFIRL